ncbi:MAG: thiamine-monophosphate kinase [Acidobacteriota bacterium]|jgi:thiamine-monophosphate kinase|nr:thiamine-monophosphate kinase [Acidobacteriota bacterium]
MPLSGEDRLLRWLRNRLATPLIGDDAAILPALGPAVVTVDSQIAGVHFPPDLKEADLARRLLAVNLSDLAAMGATPTYGFLALSSAGGTAGFDHRKFFVAFLAACRSYGVTLAGGDLARHPGGTIATLTLIGTKAEDARWLRRGGAEPGQALWLGGTVGESAAGRLLIERGARLAGSRVDLPPACEAFSSALRAAARRAVRRHLRPEPQLALGRWLGMQPTGAAMDVSDGVARDLHRLCHESGAGAEIDAEALPLSSRFTRLCEALGADPLALALGGGEDYVLLFTLPAGLAPPPELARDSRRIGMITRRTRRSITIVRDGVRQKLPDIGWDHLGSDVSPLK